jgi:hypothetical protein
MDEILSSTAAAIFQFPNNSLHFLRMETQNQCNQTKFSTACLQQQFQWTLLVSTQANKELQHTPKDQILSSVKGGRSVGIFGVF